MHNHKIRQIYSKNEWQFFVAHRGQAPCTPTLSFFCLLGEGKHSFDLRSVPVRMNASLLLACLIPALLLTWGESEPESEEVVPVGGREPAPVRRPAVPGLAEPAAAP